jgi:hypothetical protein
MRALALLALVLPRLTGSARVAVVVRAYHEQVTQLRSMAWLMSGMRTSDCPQHCATIIVVPTQFDSVQTLETLVNELADVHGLPIEMLRLPAGTIRWRDLFRDFTAAAPACPQNLSKTEFIAGLCGPFRYHDPTCAERSVDAHPLLQTKICGYQNQVHYRLTDMGVEQAVEQHGGTHDYLLVTNADNVYHPLVFSAATQHGEDIVATWFTHTTHTQRVMAVKTQFKMSRIDLGAAFFSMRVIEASKLRFVTAVPTNLVTFSRVSPRAKQVAVMRLYHDSDFWFIKHAMRAPNASTKIVQDLLFHHV